MRTKNIKLNGQEFIVRVAGSSEEMMKGLSGLDWISPFGGMLFTFKTPGRYRISMSGMKFPIDAICVGADSLVKEIRTLEVGMRGFFIPRDPIKFLIEIGAGRAQEIGLSEGAYVELGDEAV